MSEAPSEAVTAAWMRLLRSRDRVLAGVERDLAVAGFPPLAWYDALLELERAAPGGLRPHRLERAMLLPQYGLSRLLDRLERAGLTMRRPCPDDGRGHVVAITPAGEALRARMWQAYAVAIRQRIGEPLGEAGAATLAALLDRLLAASEPGAGA